MIVLYIVLAIILLLILILCIDISLVFSYKEKFDFKLRLFFITLNGEKLLSLVEASEEKKDPRQVLTENKKSLTKKKKQPSDVLDTVSYIVGIIKVLLGEFTKYTRVKFTRLKVSIGTDDCAETALLYGALSSALYTILEYFDSFMTVKKNYKSIGVYPDFTSDRCRVDLKIVLKIKILHLLLIVIHTLPTLAEAKKGK